jgi:hypothetical protein
MNKIARHVTVVVSALVASLAIVACGATDGTESKTEDPSGSTEQALSCVPIGSGCETNADCCLPCGSGERDACKGSSGRRVGFVCTCIPE